MSRKGDGQLVITSGSSVSSELMFLVKWLKSGLRVLCRCACETRQIPAGLQPYLIPKSLSQLLLGTAAVQVTGLYLNAALLEMKAEGKVA